MKSIKTILGRIRYADQKYSLFNEHDRIMIGVSGGKDSMALVYCLSLYQKFKFVNFKIYPTILDLGFPGFNVGPIKKYFKTLGLELNVVDAKDVYQILKIQQKDAKHLPCSICSRMKKAAINKAAKEMGCNKVAFAHHGDDAIETLFMNEIYGGRIATFQPKMHLERIDIDFIRPFIEVREDDIKTLVKEENIPVFSSHCPNDGFTERSVIKEFLNDFYDKYPDTKANFLTMLSNYDKEVLFNDDVNYKIERLDISLRPVLTASDSLIETKLRSKFDAIRYDDLTRFIIYKKKTPIGVVSFRRIDTKVVEVSDLYLLSRCENYLNKIIKFIEFNISRKIVPVDIIIKAKIDKKLLKELGYEKTHNSGFIKRII